MSKKLRMFKFFMAHQDEQQESWLRSMAQQGLHLVNVNPLCVWTFRRGEPADIVYRLDYPTSWHEPAFLRLMQDAGWTLAATTAGWHYWSTPAIAGKAPEMFTDSASKARKFKLLLTVLLLTALPMVYLILTGNLQKMRAELTIPVVAVFGLWALLVPYTILKLMQRIRSLRGPLPT